MSGPGYTFSQGLEPLALGSDPSWPPEVRCFPPVSPRSGDTPRPYLSGVVGVPWTGLHGEASNKCTWPTRAAVIVSEQLALYSGRPRWDWQSTRRGDSRPLHHLGRKQEPQPTVCFTICGWSRPVLFFRGWGWRDLAFGVQASTSGLKVCPRCEDGSQVSPRRPLEGTGLAEGGLAPSRLATLLCSPLWPGGAEAKPRVPRGKGREAALFCCPEAAPVPPDRASTLVGSRESRG